MNKRLTTIAIGTVASSLLVLLLAAAIAPTYADTPSFPHNADAMWIEPASISLTPSMVGQLFNVTGALNMTEEIYAWQTKMFFNQTLVNCTRAGFTSGATSNYFKGHTTTATTSINYAQSFVSLFETAMGLDLIPGPHNGTLFWTEFTIVSVPANLNTVLNISREAGTNSSYSTWVLFSDSSTFLPFTPYDAIITPEFSTILILPALMAATAGALIVSKRMSRKKLK